ncbi:hypothetical protein VNO77_11127 [Canavalia gladiata]|uniref:Uncharacterized protein n=1 Tax=Canavalia gladiata TaxID=3824 RepID=A0AAN9QXI6_CANGL
MANWSCLLDMYLPNFKNVDVVRHGFVNSCMSDKLHTFTFFPPMSDCYPCGAAAFLTVIHLQMDQLPCIRVCNSGAGPRGFGVVYCALTPSS